jgi:integrase
LQKHPPVVLVAGTEEELLLALAGPPSSDQVDRPGGEADEVTPLGLRELLDPDAVVDEGHLARDRRGGVGEVEIAPLQSECLASTASGRGEEHPRREVAAVGDEGEEAPELGAVAVENVRTKAQPNGRAVGEEEVAALFRVCAEDESPAGRRDAAMFAVLYGGGLRRGELCGLDLADFDADDCSQTVRAGKGRRDRTVYLPDAVCDYMKAWIEVREHEPGALFCPVRTTGEVPITRLHGETVWYILKRRQRQAGLEGITPHAMRRAFVSNLLEAGVGLLTVQELVGHANAVTTARYDRRGEGARRRATQVLRLPPA